MRLRTGLVSLVAFVVAAVVACTASTGGPSGSPASPPAAQHATGPAGHQVTKLAAATAAVQASPKQLRARFEQLLGLHTLLAVRVMRSVVSAAPELRQAAVASLQENTDALSLLVVSAYGGAQGDRFKQLWQRHITDLSAYANGVAGNDASAKQTARAALMAYCDAYGAWFAQASKGRVKASDAVGGVRMHVEELMQQLDAYAARDYGDHGGVGARRPRGDGGLCVGEETPSTPASAPTGRSSDQATAPTTTPPTRARTTSRPAPARAGTWRP